MDESIYNLVPREYYAPPKQPMHKSCFDPNAGLTGSTFGCKGSTRLPGAGSSVKKECALFGPRYEDLVSKEYLKKKEVEEQQVSTYKRPVPNTKPGVPSRATQPVMGIHTSKNFITANAVEAILAAPRVQVVPESNY